MDLEFNQAYIDDEKALADAITDLIERKPGLRARQVSGDVGAGNRGASSAEAPDLISIIRGL